MARPSRARSPQYTVFVDGLLEKLKEKVEQVPFLKALIVPLDKLAEMRVKHRTGRTRENILYKKATDLMKCKGEDMTNGYFAVFSSFK